MKRERNEACRNTSVAENSKTQSLFPNPETFFTSIGITDENEKEVMRTYVKEIFTIALEYLNSASND